MNSATPGGMHQVLLTNNLTLNLMRRVGLPTMQDRHFFARVTGRSNRIIRSAVMMVDRRRRQAYLLLRRVLPIEMAQRAIGLRWSVLLDQIVTV
jgi:hypothetical protein